MAKKTEQKNNISKRNMWNVYRSKYANKLAPVILSLNINFVVFLVSAHKMSRIWAIPTSCSNYFPY